MYLFQPSLNASSPDDQSYAFAPLPTRQQQLADLETKEFDVLVIGGGATGSGVALDAVSRGLYFFMNNILMIMSSYYRTAWFK